MTLKTKIKDILGDEWVLKDKYAEERLDLIDLLSEYQLLHWSSDTNDRYAKWATKSRLLH
jgi:hypothetical protein